MENLRPKYLTVAEELKKEIYAEAWEADTRLPAEQDLARQYQVSRQTIRKALDVLEEERLVARRQGSGTYVLGGSAQENARTSHVGMLTTWSDLYVYPQYLRVIEDALSKNGYMMLMSATKGNVFEERNALQELLNANLSGLIVECTSLPFPNPNLDLYREFRKRGIPIVFINGHYAELEDSVFVTMDDRDGSYKLTMQAVKQGCRRIGGFFKYDQHGIERYYGCIRALMDNGLAYEPEQFVWFYKMEGEEYFRRMAAEGQFDAFQNTDALLCYNDVTAIWLYHTLEEAAWTDKPAMFCFDNTEMLQVARLPVTAYSLPIQEIASGAVRKLLAMMSGKSEKPEYVPWRECAHGYSGPWL